MTDQPGFLKLPASYQPWPIPGRQEANIRTNGDNLVCPGCGEEYLHHGKVTAYDTGEDHLLAIRTIADGTNSRVELVKNSGDNPSSRRHGLTIEFWCEHCHAAPELRIAQHKGNTHITWLFTPHTEKP